MLMMHIAHIDGNGSEDPEAVADWSGFVVVVSQTENVLRAGSSTTHARAYVGKVVAFQLTDPPSPPPEHEVLNGNTWCLC